MLVILRPERRDNINMHGILLQSSQHKSAVSDAVKPNDVNCEVFESVKVMAL